MKHAQPTSERTFWLVYGLAAGSGALAFLAGIISFIWGDWGWGLALLVAGLFAVNIARLVRLDREERDQP
jgi:short subunit fatty acids transporter